MRWEAQRIEAPALKQSSRAPDQAGKRKAQPGTAGALRRLPDRIGLDRLPPSAQRNALAGADPQIDRDRRLMQQVCRDDQALIAPRGSAVKILRSCHLDK